LNHARKYQENEIVYEEMYAKAHADKRAIAMALRDQGIEVNIIESITGLSAKEIFDK